MDQVWAACFPTMVEQACVSFLWANRCFSAFRGPWARGLPGRVRGKGEKLGARADNELPNCSLAISPKCGERRPLVGVLIGSIWMLWHTMLGSRVLPRVLLKVLPSKSSEHLISLATALTGKTQKWGGGVTGENIPISLTPVESLLSHRKRKESIWKER